MKDDHTLDAQEQRTLQAALERREREFRTVNEIISLVNHPADLPSTLSRALDIARDVLGTDILILSLLDDEGQLSYTAWSCAAQIEEKVLAHCSRHVDKALLYRALETRQVISISDVEGAGASLTEEQKDAYRRLAVRRVAYGVLLHKGRALGVMTLMRHDTPEIGAVKISILEEVKELLAILIENARLQRQIRELSIIKERQRLAHELHDSVTQSLFTLSLTAQGLKAALQDAPDSHREAARRDAARQEAVDLLIEQTETVKRDMRSLIEQLRPVDLQEHDVARELRRHVKGLERTTGIAAHLTTRGNARALPRAVQRHFNRITQEALSNVAQHARAERVDVLLEVEPSRATLSICDDGVGFNLQKVTLGESDSLGLLSMRERAEMMGGALSVHTAPGCGTTITARAPLTREAA